MVTVSPQWYPGESVRMYHVKSTRVGRVLEAPPGFPLHPRGAALVAAGSDPYCEFLCGIRPVMTSDPWKVLCHQYRLSQCPRGTLVGGVRQ